VNATVERNSGIAKCLSPNFCGHLVIAGHLQKIEASSIEDFYGFASDIQKTSESGYILFYQSRE